jgi:2-dehydropantoate 2-reductase
MDCMRIAVIGTGAVGGYFGGRLAQAGHDVHFVARGETLEALRAGGLRVTSIAGDFAVEQPNVTNDPADIGPADVILLAVKATQVLEVAPTLKPLVGPETILIPLQNGLEAPAMAGEALGKQIVLGGLCKIFAFKTGPATIEHQGLEPTIEIGELDGRRSERVERIRAAFSRAQGMTTAVPEDIQTAMWQKLIYVSPLGAVGAVARAPVGILRAAPRTLRLIEAMMEEIVAVGRKRGVALDPTLPAQAIRRVDSLPATATASMHRDILSGRPSELDLQVGTLVRFAEEAGVPVPVHTTIYAALLPAEMRARGQVREV